MIRPLLELSHEGQLGYQHTYDTGTAYKRNSG